VSTRVCEGPSKTTVHIKKNFMTQKILKMENKHLEHFWSA